MNVCIAMCLDYLMCSSIVEVLVHVGVLLVWLSIGHLRHGWLVHIMELALALSLCSHVQFFYALGHFGETIIEIVWLLKLGILHYHVG